MNIYKDYDNKLLALHHSAFHYTLHYKCECIRDYWIFGSLYALTVKTVDLIITH